MPSVGSVVVTTGRRGVTGSTGASGTLPEPASLVNGRQPSAWVPCLPLRGNSVNAAEATMSGCLAFTNRFATSDTSGHVNLWAGVYGLTANGTGINLVSGDIWVDFYTVMNSSSSQAIRLMGSSGYRELWFQGDGWRWQYNLSNRDFIYYNYNSSPLFGYQGTYTRMVSWGQYQTTGFFQLGQSSRGIIYANITGVGFKFLWDGTYCWVRLDNGSVDWALVNACDARLKTDIAPSTYNCLETVRKIRLYQYRWKDHRHRPGYPQAAKPDEPLIPIGFIAQRLKEDFPEGVQGGIRRPKGGFKLLRDRSVRNSDANVMMALLCGAVQELDDAITKYEQRATNRA